MPLAVIMPVAGKGTRFHELGQQYPKCCLPYQGIPIVVHNLRLLFSKEPEADVFIVIGHQGEFVVSIVKQFMHDKLDNIHFVEYAPIQGKEGPLTSIVSGLSAMESSPFSHDGILVLLGDAVFTKIPMTRHENWLGYQEVEDFQRWCMVTETENNQLFFFDKPKERPPTDKALSGSYYFAEPDRFSGSAAMALTLHDGSGETQISHALHRYLATTRFKTSLVHNHPIDLGTLGDYLKNRGVSNSRSFNTVYEQGDHIIKTSVDPQKMFNEVAWYQNVPASLWKNIPRIYKNTWKDSFPINVGYVMENVTGVTLRDYFLFISRDAEEWEMVIHDLFRLSQKMSFREFKTKSFFPALLKKTKDRIAQLNVDVCEGSFSAAYDFMAAFSIQIAESAKDEMDQFFHGDLCLSNVIYDPQSKNLSMIDPRGDIFGNRLYDYAKLCHSFLYPYDYIDAGLYILNPETGEPFFFGFGSSTETIQNIFREKLYSEFHESQHRLLKFIVASLFLSMIPLHDHNPTNQALYYRTFKRIWEELLAGNNRM